MAAIDQYIERIPNPELQELLKQEVNRLVKKKSFGLVYEKHMPDNVQMPEVSIRRGTKVVLRGEDVNDIFEVQAINEGTALCRNVVSFEDKEYALSELVAIAQQGDIIYPYLKPMDSVENAPDSNLWHTLIEADNYHALQALAYLYPGKVDCIYIDPPYNKPDSHDWKYNCNYVDGTDAYRHSKWLSMMEVRLKIAKKLLNPENSVLIVTIDEMEYHHLGCLLEQLFPEAKIQMISSIINPHGVPKRGDFCRVTEYLFFVRFGDSEVLPIERQENAKLSGEVRWLMFRRTNPKNIRTSRPSQFYPIYINKSNHIIEEIGDPITPDINRFSVPQRDGCETVFPVREDGVEMLWGLTPDEARRRLKNGYMKAGGYYPNKQQTFAIQYLPSNTIKHIETGVANIVSRNDDGSVNAYYESYKTVFPKTQWSKPTHDAMVYGTKQIANILTDKRFDFPKSLYAVHDSIRYFVANKPGALILDFFAGSGTTLHAVNLLNKEDGGNRRCIMVTNNEIGELKEQELRPLGIKPGDEEWEKWGIARYVNWPRTKCSILGIDINGSPINGEYLTPITEIKSTDRKFSQINFMPSIASIKQKKALISLINKQKDIKLPSLTEDQPFIVSDDDSTNASILFDVSQAEDWMEALDGNDHITNFFIVAEKDSEYKKVKSAVSEMMGQIEETVPVTMPMSDGFKANAAFFKLEFLDKRSVARGKQLQELLPMLWMKAGAIGKCPNSVDGDYAILPENRMAILMNESSFPLFKKDMGNQDNIDMVFLVTDSQSAYLAMTEDLDGVKTYQLYRDYLENFRINYSTK